MREGRTEQPVFAGSVINRLKADRKHTLNRVNEACCAAVIAGSEKTAVSSGMQSFGTDDDCLYAFYEALNRMAASGGKPLAVSINMILPAGTEADELKSIMDRFAELAEEENVDIADVHSSVSANVLTRIMQVTCIGRLLPEYIQPEQDAGHSVTVIYAFSDSC